VAEARSAGHVDHDGELIAALADGILVEADLARATGQVASCAACARLHADLVAITAASRTLPAPARTRDFRLTAADVSRLTAAAPEPVPTSARPVGDMTTTTPHATHDLERLSTAIDGTIPAADLPSIDAQLAACRECADLHADLLALVSANRALRTPTRPRDYQLSQDDATRLAAGGLAGWLRRIGSPRDRLSRPLAIGLTTLGLVGVLVGTAPSLLPFGSASSAGAAPTSAERVLADKAADSLASAAPSAAGAPAAALPGAATEAPAYAGPSSAPVKVQTDGATPTQRENDTQGGDSQGGDSQAAASQPTLAAPPPGSATIEAVTSAPAGDDGPSAMLVASAVALLAGVGLFGLRRGARRARDA
jgi:hypothetical protein